MSNNNASRIDKNTTPQLEFAETAEGINHRISMNTMDPVLKRNSCFFVICKAFLTFVVAKRAPIIDAQTAANILLKQWVYFFGPPKLLVTDKGTESFITIIAIMCSFLASNFVQDTLALLGRMI